jgi:crotonobetainyl-CoA:carnitine CoA-transferase CaiB-like acyl-CoA transferase
MARMQTTSPDDASGPCRGIRVLDFTTVMAGPLCTQILGDLGADVIKIESRFGDTSRYSGGPFREAGFSAFLAQFNRNKRSLVLDLKQEQSRDVARRLALEADVVVQNYRPGVAERLGIDHAALSRDNPGLVFVAITGFGSDGPYADLPAYDHVIQGLVGLMPTQGGDGPPKLVQGGAADKITGLTAANAITAALLARERGDGQGQRIEVPMMDAYAAFGHPESMMSRSFPPLESDGLSVSDVFRTWPTLDGYVVGLVVQDAQFRGLCGALGRDDLAEDERFAGMLQRFANFRALAPELAGEIAKWTTAEFVARAREVGAPFAPVQDIEDFLADPQVAHARTVFEADDPRFGPTRYLRHPVRYESTPASLRRHAPRLGEHSNEVLAEAGFSQAEIEHLREAGAIG